MTPFYVDNIIRTALEEDINYYDVSGESIFSAEHSSRAQWVAKASGCVTGISIALRVFALLDSSFAAECFFADGERVQAGDVIAAFTGKTIHLLQGERTALNLLQHLSGIATMTAAAVDAVQGTKAQIADTRKTLPGLRALQKYAVRCGGGKNHRFNLSDAAMLKDTHIDAAGSIAAAAQRLRENLGHMTKIEIETRNLDEVREALAAKADCIMLDNMDCETMREAVRIVNGRAVLEASGNVTLETLQAIAQTGVDIISMGALTHSVTAFDVSMKMLPQTEA